MVVNVVWQVFSRYILNSPSTITDELARYLLIWVGVLGIAYTSGKSLHLSLDLLPKTWSETRFRILNIITYLLIITFALLAMVIGGVRLVYVTYTLDQISPAMHIPLAYVYLIIPFSGLLIIYYKIHDLIHLRND